MTLKAMLSGAIVPDWISQDRLILDGRPESVIYDTCMSRRQQGVLEQRAVLCLDIGYRGPTLESGLKRILSASSWCQTGWEQSAMGGI